MNLPSLLKIYDRSYDLIKKLLRRLSHNVFHIIFALSGQRLRDGQVTLYSPPLSTEDYRELTIRKNFYLSASDSVAIVRKRTPSWPETVSPTPMMIFGERSRYVNWLVVNRPGTFDVDFRSNHMDGWAWIGLANYLSVDRPDFRRARQQLNEKVGEVKQQNRTRCYVFGTGPSLEKALDHDWTDGIRIVCNTIVRDPVLWDHINPDFIVAGDAIYHFGHTTFACAFRKDLHARLNNCRTLFLYPAQFHPIVIKEFADLQAQLIPIPSGWQRKIHIDLTRTFRLPNLGNVLGLLLLPLACTLSRRIFLWGFDGRAPDDKLFWANSNKHTYAEHMDELKKSHPRFFDHHVPITDPTKYVRENRGEQLELVLQMAEKAGWYFEMMHPSWTSVLQRRYHGDK